MTITSAPTIHTLKAHLAINVRNVNKSIEFYKKMLGLEPSKVRAGYAKFDVVNPPLNLTLNQSAVTGKGGLSHLGIQVATSDDVQKLKGRWEAAGLTPREEIQTTCCYAVQDKAWVHDPDGNEWEAFVVLKDNLPEGTGKTKEECCVPAAGGSKKEAACC